MRPTGAIQRTLSHLTHPLAISAMLALALNALLLQPLWPAWWTGKLGDVAWLAFAPLVVALGLSLLPALSRRPDRVGPLAIALTGAGFALVKAVPGVNAAAVAAFARLGFPAKLTLDPTDLIALPGLLIAWHVWQQPARANRVGPRHLAALSLAALALLADSAGPQDRGAVCLAQDGDVLYATSEINNYAYFNSRVIKSIYRSDDGGLTWVFQEVQTGELNPNSAATPTPGPESPPSSYCEKLSWPVTDPTEPAIQYFGIEGKGLYRSKDGGATLKLEAEFRDPVYGALIHPSTGNLVVAAGRSGVHTRAPTGEWQTTILKNETP